MRKHLVWVLGLALAIGVSAFATAGTTQQLTVSLTPSKAPKAKAVGAKLRVITQAGSDTTGPGAVKSANRVQVFFDNDVTFNTKGVPTCDPNKLGNTTTDEAKALCPKAIIGGGKNTVFIAGDPNAILPGVITLFNGVPKGKNPTIIIHTRVDAAGATTVISGVLTTQKGDLGTKLDFTIPPPAGGTAVGLFDVTLSKTTGNSHYVSVKCGDANKTLNYKGIFDYAGGEPRHTVTGKQKCSVKG